MASLFWISALAAGVSVVSAFAIGEVPTQTVGYGEPFMQEPTEAPSMELVKAKLAKRALTNVCTEWTIPGGFGPPECYNSDTCLFTSATDGYFYEGCGQTSIRYDWTTTCWPYPQIGTAPVSEIYCSEEAPFCGYLAFLNGDGNIYFNYGCSTVSYSLYVELAETSSYNLDGQGGSSIIESDPVIVAIPTTTSALPTARSSSSSSSSRPVVGTNSSPKSTPIGAIVGGAVGGVAVIAFIAFLIWFCLRKRKQDAAANQAAEAHIQQQQADAATAAALHNYNRISEIGGTMKPMPEGTYAPPAVAGAFPPTGNEKIMGQSVNEYSPTPQSPPPVYAQPPPQLQSPQPSTTSAYPSNYTELDNQNPQAGGTSAAPPVSPVGTYSVNELAGQSIVTSQSPQPHMQAGQNLGAYPTQQALPSEQGGQQVAYQAPPQNVQGGQNTVTYQAYQVPPQNMPQVQNTGQYQPYRVPQSVPQNVQGMSGNAASIRPVRQSDVLPDMDMSGAPMSENYHHHELP